MNYVKENQNSDDRVKPGTRGYWIRRFRHAKKQTTLELMWEAAKRDNKDDVDVINEAALRREMEIRTGKLTN